MWKRDWVWVAACLACTACGSDGGDDDSSGGSSGNGGSSASGSSGNGGSGGSGGSQGGSSGSSGGSSNASDIPQPTGAVGSAALECADGTVSNFMCSAGNVCCVNDPADTAMCVSSFSACTCAVAGDCTAEGCHKDADCGAGLACCGLRNGFSKIAPLFVATSCKTSCEGSEWKICTSDADCPSGKTCHPATLNYLYCR